MSRYDFHQFYVTAVLIGLNVLYFIFLTLHGDTAYDLEMMLRYGAVYEPLITERHEYYRLLAACFMHFGIRHLMNNMIVLFALGRELEPTLGRLRYLLLYLISGVGANALSCAFHVMQGEAVVSAGASGAIFGVMGGLLWVTLFSHGRRGSLSRREMVIYAVLSVYLGLASSGVDNVAHVAGLVLGFLLASLMYRSKSVREETN